MNKNIRNRLTMQGFCSTDLDYEPLIDSLARWTPITCASVGTSGMIIGNSLIPISISLCPCTIASLTGLWFGNGIFFIILGILTFTGGLTNRSIYDRFYNVIISKIFKTPPIPLHGSPRRFGCAIGGFMYTMSGIGFLIGNVWLAFIPSIFMITFAFIAGITQWCFASAIYNGIFNRGKNKYWNKEQ